MTQNPQKTSSPRIQLERQKYIYQQLQRRRLQKAQRQEKIFRQLQNKHRQKAITYFADKEKKLTKSVVLVDKHIQGKLKLTKQRKAYVSQMRSRKQQQDKLNDNSRRQRFQQLKRQAISHQALLHRKHTLQLKRNEGLQKVYPIAVMMKQQRNAKSQFHAQRSKTRIESIMRLAQSNYKRLIQLKSQKASRAQIVQKNLKAAQVKRQAEEELMIQKILQKRKKVQKWKKERSKHQSQENKARHQKQLLFKEAKQQSQRRISQALQSKIKSTTERLAAALQKGTKVTVLKNTFNSSLTDFNKSIVKNKGKLLQEHVQKRDQIHEKHRELQWRLREMQRLSEQNKNKSKVQLLKKRLSLKWDG